MRSIRTTSAAVLALLFASAFACDQCGDHSHDDHDYTIVGPQFGLNSWAFDSDYIVRGRGDTWQQSSGQRWEWQGVYDGPERPCPEPCPEPEPCPDPEPVENLARACAVSLDRYHADFIDEDRTDNDNAATVHDINSVIQQRQEILYDIDNTVTHAENAEYHQYRLSDGAYDMMYFYQHKNGTKGKYYNYCVSKYLKDQKKHIVDITDSAGLNIFSTYEVVVHSDSSTATGFNYTVIAVEASEEHKGLIPWLHETHRDILYFKYKVEAAVTTAAEYYRDSVSKKDEEIKMDWKIAHEQIDRFISTFTLESKDQWSLNITLKTAETRHFGAPSYYVHIYNNKHSNMDWDHDPEDRFWVFSEKQDWIHDGQLVYETQVFPDAKFNASYTCTFHLESGAEWYITTLYQKDVYNDELAEAFHNFAAVEKGTLENIDSTPFAVAAFNYARILFVRPGALLYSRPDLNDLQATVKMVNSSYANIKLEYFDMIFHIGVQYLGEAEYEIIPIDGIGFRLSATIFNREEEKWQVIYEVKKTRVSYFYWVEHLATKGSKTIFYHRASEKNTQTEDAEFVKHYLDKIAVPKYVTVNVESETIVNGVKTIPVKMEFNGTEFTYNNATGNITAEFLKSEFHKHFHNLKQKVEFIYHFVYQVHKDITKNVTEEEGDDIVVIGTLSADGQNATVDEVTTEEDLKKKIAQGLLDIKAKNNVANETLTQEDVSNALLQGDENATNETNEITEDDIKESLAMGILNAMTNKTIEVPENATTSLFQTFEEEEATSSLILNALGLVLVFVAGYFGGMYGYRKYQDRKVNAMEFELREALLNKQVYGRV